MNFIEVGKMENKTSSWWHEIDFFSISTKWLNNIVEPNTSQIFYEDVIISSIRFGFEDILAQIRIFVLIYKNSSLHQFFSHDFFFIFWKSYFKIVRVIWKSGISDFDWYQPETDKFAISLRTDIWLLKWFTVQNASFTFLPICILLRKFCILVWLFCIYPYWNSMKLPQCVSLVLCYPWH